MKENDDGNLTLYMLNEQCYPFIVFNDGGDSVIDYFPSSLKLLNDMIAFGYVFGQFYA